MKRLTPLERWKRDQIEKPVRKIVESLMRGWYVRCDECNGTGKDDGFCSGRCLECSGTGQLYVMPMVDPLWRRRFDQELKQAGFDPAVFTDTGKLVAANFSSRAS